ncbi:MAG: asparagine synthase (glutamine-hydrolyzing) [Bacteroidetes bacterium]|nr:asparagine synthase (glutamine-hydrolyzing) [Bacteroidota bacterium]
MCGLLSYYQTEPLSIQIFNDIYNSLQLINHRGPDGEGIVLLNTQTGNYINWQSNLKIDYSNYNMVLGHKRLAILDLSEAGRQPMIKDDLIIIFNGEIYNFIELKKELEILGEVFCSNTDTEVILKAYKIWGSECLKKFNGMWSIILYDTKLKKMFVSRGRFGIKPLIYHTFKDGSWIIISEEKQLFAFEKFDKKINFNAVKILLEHQFIGLDNSTFYQNVFKFKTAHYSLQSIDSFSFNKQEKYYEINTNNIHYNYKNKEKAVEAFKIYFNKAIEYTLIADVPIGLGFSGGVDSSRIVYECYTNFQKPETFSAVFPDSKQDESYYINLVKNDLDLKSNFCYPEKEFTYKDFEKLTYHLDAPVPSSSYYAQWCLSRLVKEKGIKVLLVGQGADEVFAGYHHHFYRYLRSLLINLKILKFYKEISSFSEIKGRSKMKLFKIVLNELILVLRVKLFKKRDWCSLWFFSSSLNQFLKNELLIYQLPFFLKSDDRIGMAFNFESRYPFLDHKLVTFGFECADDIKIQNGWQKWIIRESNKLAPHEISWRKDKIGYVMPENLLPELDEDIIAYTKEKVGILSSNAFLNFSVGVWLKQQLENK